MKVLDDRAIHHSNGTTFTVWYEIGQSGIEFRRIEVESDRDITATTWRRLNLREVEKEVQQTLLDRPPVAPLTDLQSRQGRGPISDETLAAHANLYLWVWPLREKWNVNKRMLEEMNGQGINMSLATVRNRTEKCIEQGWLVRRFGQGKPGAMPGPRLLKWWEDNDSNPEELRFWRSS